MGTKTDIDSISAALFSRTKFLLLGVLFGQPEEGFYLRQLVRILGRGVGALQRELTDLSNAGIIRRTVRGRQVYFQADPECPVFEELKNLMVKTAGISDVLRTALAPLADRIKVAAVYGSFARGQARKESDIDLLIVGDVAFTEVVKALSSSQVRLGREINPTVYPPSEFLDKVSKGHHFLRNVLKGQKIFLIGDEHEFERMAKKRLAP
jgi:uncharacterized protein